VGVLVAYLVLGLLTIPKTEERGRGEGALPMASWSLAEIEARNRAGLQHVAATQAAPSYAQEPLPERLLPDLVPLKPSDLSTVGSRAEGNLRLKFTTLIWNAGLGPLETRGARNPETGELEVYQYVYRRVGELALTGGAPPELRAERGRWVGTFNYEHRHGHLHFDGFAHYGLWRVGEGGELVEMVAENAKVGFCLMDIKHMASQLTHLESGLIEVPGGPVYAGCREDVQGISVGWGDEYLSLLLEQDLDLMDAPSGSYAVVVTTNPERTIEELSYDNNAAVTYFRLEDERVVWSSVEDAGGG
jgi:hypothetical protein